MLPIHKEIIFDRELNIYGDKENPLFMAKDVAEVIDHSNVSVMINNLDPEEKTMERVGTLNNSYSAWFLNEDGLYEVLMQSRKPIAKMFKKEVKRMLKELRSKGVTATNDYIQKAISDPEFAIQTLTALKNEREARLRAELELNEAKPKIEFAEAISGSDDLISIGEFAKILNKNGINMGQNRLFAWLIDNNYVMRNKDKRIIPKQRAAERGYLYLYEGTYSNVEGQKIYLKTLVTIKGQIHLLNKLKKMDIK